MRKPDSDVMAAVVQSLCERLDTPRSLSVWLCFQHNQEALLELPLPDTAVAQPGAFHADYFITEYLSKYKGLKTSYDLRKAALDKWLLAEETCGATNRRFREYHFRPFSGRVEAALFNAQRKISAVLGALRLPVVLSDCRWGPGATFDLRRGMATPDKKISEPISVTASALPFIRAVLEADPRWSQCFTGFYPDGPLCLTSDVYRIVRGSRFLTVPKNAKTDRCIAAEPTGNSFLQQGVHSYLRRRLLRFGVDLDDQSINQRRAQEAFHCGLSTLDLSAASDTISRELVYHLLPLDWALFLDALRSPETLVNGRWIRTEKFASMGNAFCFELETLIFWALASSVAENLGSVDSVTVYGDDIIVPRHSFDSVVEILTVCGFSVNAKKSFKDGNFFESCGKHFYRGQEVTPVYQKELLQHPSEFIRAHNRLIRLASRALFDDPGKVVARAASEIVRKYTHSPVPRIPFGVPEDGGFLRPLSEFSLDPNHGFRCHVLDFVPEFSQAREDAMYAYKLRRMRHESRSVDTDGALGLMLLQESQFRNSMPCGHVANVTKGRWRTKVRYIPEVSCWSKSRD